MKKQRMLEVSKSAFVHADLPYYSIISQRYIHTLCLFLCVYVCLSISFKYGFSLFICFVTCVSASLLKYFLCQNKLELLIGKYIRQRKVFRLICLLVFFVLRHRKLYSFLLAYLGFKMSCVSCWFQEADLFQFFSYRARVWLSSSVIHSFWFKCLKLEVFFVDLFCILLNCISVMFSLFIFRSF